jgi:hypothetical protein
MKILSGYDEDGFYTVRAPSPSSYPFPLFPSLTPSFTAIFDPSFFLTLRPSTKERWSGAWSPSTSSPSTHSLLAQRPLPPLLPQRRSLRFLAASRIRSSAKNSPPFLCFLILAWGSPSPQCAASLPCALLTGVIMYSCFVSFLHFNFIQTFFIRSNVFLTLVVSDLRSLYSRILCLKISGFDLSTAVHFFFNSR